MVGKASSNKAPRSFLFLPTPCTLLLKWENEEAKKGKGGNKKQRGTKTKR